MVAFKALDNKTNFFFLNLFGCKRGKDKRGRKGERGERERERERTLKSVGLQFPVVSHVVT